MKFEWICPRWGSEDLTPEAFLDAVSGAGYTGVELATDQPDPTVEETARLAKERGLFVIAQHWDVFDRDLEVHLKRLEERFRMLAGLTPDLLNSHTGRNLFTLRENITVFRFAQELAAELNLPLVHETHRGRCCHAPWRTVELLREMPELRLTLDMSHWCNVSESLLEDQHDFLEQVVPHVDHIHARVGWAHGPQVSDPRAPEWSGAVEAHIHWWDRVVKHHREAGTEKMLICPEFGPVPYLPVLPYTGKPVADQWDINVSMMNRLKQRYEES